MDSLEFTDQPAQLISDLWAQKSFLQNMRRVVDKDTQCQAPFFTCTSTCLHSHRNKHHSQTHTHMIIEKGMFLHTQLNTHLGTLAKITKGTVF